MAIELTEAEQKNREIILKIEELARGFKMIEGGSESLLVGATIKSPNPVGTNSHDIFIAVAGGASDVSLMLYSFLKNKPVAYQALRMAFLKISEELTPGLVNLTGEALKKYSKGN